MFVLGIKKIKGIEPVRLLAVTLVIATIFVGCACCIPCVGAKTDLPSGGSRSTAIPVAFTGTSAKAAVLMEADSGDLIFSQNENARLPMASTTKIMTALVTLERASLDEKITIPAAAVGIEGSSIYLVENEILTIEDLLYALMLQSANDAAVALALAVAGSVDAFATLMNEKAVDLGLTDSHFVNPHGLDADEHYTTAKELALITRAAMENPTFRRICGTERKSIPMQGIEGKRLLLNHNKMLRTYDGAIGVKTGFTKKTGRCLVSAAERDGVTLIAVTLGAPDDWRDHTAMLDYGFSLYESVSLCEVGSYHAPLWVQSGTQEYVMVENTDALSVTLRRNHGEIVCRVELPRFVFASIQVGDQLGQLSYWERQRDGSLREIGSVPLYAANTVEAVRYKISLWERIKALLSR
jgi:D-alanyl-D-alanine carboxypeptidase